MSQASPPQPTRRRRRGRSAPPGTGPGYGQPGQAPPGPVPQGQAHGHAAHAHASSAALDLPRRIVTVLTATVLACALAALVGLALTWPDRDAARDLAATTNAFGDVEIVEGTITALRIGTCEGGSGEDRRVDGTVAATVTCAKADVVLGEGVGPFEVDVPVPATRAGLGVGDGVRVARYPATDELPEVYAYVDRARRVPLIVLGAAFVLAVGLLARWRGLVSVAGLVAAYAGIGLVVIPALQTGGAPVVTTACLAVLLLLLLLFGVHGLNGKTAAAYLGTVAGLGLTTVMAGIAVGYAGLDGLVDEEALTLSRLTTHGGLADVVICGLVIGSLGVLNDVTVTQASAVWELRAASDLRPFGLFVAGMRIGRDHLSSTVYTVAFAYAGAALPTLILVNLYGQPLHDLLQSGAVAQEIVGVVVAGLGLVASIPLTTGIAALAAGRARRPGE